MPLQPVARQSVSDAVFRQLEAEIISGNLAPGEALPAERALTEALGVNRQAVREALKRLDQAGLVEISHGGATRVCDFRRTAGLDLLSTLLVSSGAGIDVGVARSIMEMRACIGPDAARLCAGRAVAPLPARLLEVVDAMTAAGDDMVALAELDWRFWELVIDGADNIAYRLAFNSLRDGAAPLGDALAVVLGDELRDLDGHRAIARAVAAGDGHKAETAARRVLARGSAATVTLLSALAAGGVAAGEVATGGVAPAADPDDEPVTAPTRARKRASKRPAGS